jgi:hypothetical protein
MTSFDVASKKTLLHKPAREQRNVIDDVPLDHIVFNDSGHLLATVDDLGTISIWEQDSIANQLTLRQHFPSDPGTIDVLSTPAGKVVYTRWLHSEFKVHVSVKLAKTGDQWTCQTSIQKAAGPINAVGKEALLAVTSDGRVP